MSTSRIDGRSRRTAVVGLGNTLMGDDGLGVAALTRLRLQWSVLPEVDWIDGGTAGMCLLPVVEGATRVLLIDAIDMRVAPGTKIVIERDRLPRYLATKVSPHQIDLRDVLALAELRGTLPDDAVAVGLQPAMIGMSTELSDIVASRLDELVDEIVRVLTCWGHRCTRIEGNDAACGASRHSAAAPA